MHYLSGGHRPSCGQGTITGLRRSTRSSGTRVTSIRRSSPVGQSLNTPAPVLPATRRGLGA